jgi:hypothetical protein
VNGLKISFLGLFDATEWQPSVNWNGDELILETKNGKVNAHWHFDVDDNKAAQLQKGFLSKILKF